MKRRALERHLTAHGAAKNREGSNHVIWMRNGIKTAVPRHNEISPATARQVCKDLGVPVPRSVT